MIIFSLIESRWDSEIQTEKIRSRPLTQLDGWKIKTEGSEVTLTKDVGGVQMVISLNVNYIVDSALSAVYSLMMGPRRWTWMKDVLNDCDLKLF